jgi:hypothetical protein
VLRERSSLSNRVLGEIMPPLPTKPKSACCAASISPLRNAALKSVQYKKELAQVRAQNIDITKFESQLNDFKDSFGRNYRLASDGFEEAVKRIDEAIKDLEKTKEALHKSANNLRIANNKADELTIKRLTRDNPTMRQKFSELAGGLEDE